MAPQISFNGYSHKICKKVRFRRLADVDFTTRQDLPDFVWRGKKPDFKTLVTKRKKRATPVGTPEEKKPKIEEGKLEESQNLENVLNTQVEFASTAANPTMDISMEKTLGEEFSWKFRN
jgi:hypothetical protein